MPLHYSPCMRRAFSLIELLVVIGIIGLLLAILLPAMERARHKGYVVACTANLHQLGLALQMYAGDNHGALPRTVYVPDAPLTEGTGASAADAFVGGAGGVSVNDLTAPLWLLLRASHTKTDVMICPYNDVNEFSADPAKPATTANFSAVAKHLGYSYANCYPSSASVAAGYKVAGKLPNDFPLMADMNPGTKRHANVAAVKKGSPKSVVELGNSENHEQEGQNVLYADGRVEYKLTPLCGVADNNIYCNDSGQIVASPVGPFDSVLLPE